MAIGVFHHHLLGPLKQSPKWHTHLLSTSDPYCKLLPEKYSKTDDITPLLRIPQYPLMAQKDKIIILEILDGPHWSRDYIAGNWSTIVPALYYVKQHPGLEKFNKIVKYKKYHAYIYHYQTI